MADLALTRIRTRKLGSDEESFAGQLIFDIEVSSDYGATWAVLPTRGGIALRTDKGSGPVAETAIAFVPTHECFPDFPDD